MINELTQKQVDKFLEYVEEWTKIGLSCDSLDLDGAFRPVID